MAHKTRKKLTKSELKKDPVNEALMNAMYFLQHHFKQFVIGGVALIVAVLVIQSLSGNAQRQADESIAQYFLAGQMYNMGMENLRYGDIETSVGQLQGAQQIARNNYRTYPGRESGRRSQILAAKIGIIFGMNSEAISELQSFLAADPGTDLENSASLHLAIALENRGGVNDLLNAQDLYRGILENTPELSQLAWESYSGLSRILFTLEDYEASRENLDAALAISRDTTDFVSYQIARLDMAVN
jgi:tetratricopeptide (TPR) repeat protein